MKRLNDRLVALEARAGDAAPVDAAQVDRLVAALTAGWGELADFHGAVLRLARKGALPRFEAALQVAYPDD